MHTKVLIDKNTKKDPYFFSKNVVKKTARHKFRKFIEGTHINFSPLGILTRNFCEMRYHMMHLFYFLPSWCISFQISFSTQKNEGKIPIRFSMDEDHIFISNEVINAFAFDIGEWKYI